MPVTGGTLTSSIVLAAVEVTWCETFRFAKFDDTRVLDFFEMDTLLIFSSAPPPRPRVAISVVLTIR